VRGLGHRAFEAYVDIWVETRGAREVGRTLGAPRVDWYFATFQAARKRWPELDGDLPRRLRIMGRRYPLMSSGCRRWAGLRAQCGQKVVLPARVVPRASPVARVRWPGRSRERKRRGCPSRTATTAAWTAEVGPAAVPGHSDRLSGLLKAHRRSTAITSPVAEPGDGEWNLGVVDGTNRSRRSVQGSAQTSWVSRLGCPGPSRPRERIPAVHLGSSGGRTQDPAPSRFSSPPHHVGLDASGSRRRSSFRSLSIVITISPWRVYLPWTVLGDAHSPRGSWLPRRVDLQRPIRARFVDELASLGRSALEAGRVLDVVPCRFPLRSGASPVWRTV